MLSKKERKKVCRNKSTTNRCLSLFKIKMKAQVFYRFHHSTTWYTFECPGMMQRDQFLRCLQEKHQLRRIIMEDTMQFVRPWTRVILRHVPPHWIPKQPKQPKQPTKTCSLEVNVNVYNIDVEFGPDPYDQPREPKKYTTTTVYLEDDPFLGDAHFFESLFN